MEIPADILKGWLAFATDFVKQNAGLLHGLAHLVAFLHYITALGSRIVSRAYHFCFPVIKTLQRRQLSVHIAYCVIAKPAKNITIAMRPTFLRGRKP